MRGTGSARSLIEKDQVDIARIIEFPAAKLAQSEDNQTAPRLGIVGIDQCDRTIGGGIAQQIAHRRADCRLGKAAERAHLLFKRPAPGNLGDRGKQGDMPLGDPQPPHQRRPIFAVIGVCLSRRDDFLEQRIGTFLDQTGQEIPFGDGEAPQERAVAEDRGKQAPARGGGAPRAGEPYSSAWGGSCVFRLGKCRLPGSATERQKPRIAGRWQPVIIGPGTGRPGAIGGEMR